jgi:hypothetical protein
MNAARAMGGVWIAAAAASLLAGCMPVTTAGGGTSASRAARPAATAGIEGRYAINGARSDLVVIRRLDGDRYAVENPGNWSGVGVFDGRNYYGVFRYPADSRHGSMAKVVGIHRGELQRDRSIKVHGSFGPEEGGPALGQFDVVWDRL